jgi:hypothetical protein
MAHTRGGTEELILNPRLVICMIACGFVGLLAATAAFLAGWGLVAAVLVCSFTASVCLLPATLLAAALSETATGARVAPRPLQST